MMQSMSNVTTWENGKYNMPEGTSMINRRGDGSSSWDSTAYNMILVNETEKFLDDHMENRSDDPFFAYIALGNVHTPHSPPITFLDGTAVSGEYPSGHMDMLLEMDKVMGALTNLLKDRNMEEDTIIIFASDNGGLGYESNSIQHGHNSHGPLQGSKGTIYEGGHRIPLIIKWKNGTVPSGERRSRLVGLNDLFATLCDLAEVEVPAGQAIDSVSFADYLKKDANQDGLREYLGVWNTRSGKIVEESIRKNNLKLIRNRHSGHVSLYDLDNDISESNSLITKSAYKGVTEEMLEKLEEISPCYDREGAFSISKENGQLFERSCAWFANNKSRCNRYPLGRLECRLSCAGKSASSCFPSPTSNPTTQPTSVSSKPTSSQTVLPTFIPVTGCEDSLGFSFGKNAKGKKTCAWLTKEGDPTVTAMRISKWCNRKINGYRVKDYCQLSCNSCDGPTSTPQITSPPSLSHVTDCKDSTHFTFGYLDKKRCEWLTKSTNPEINAYRISKWCKRKFNGDWVYEYCPSSCDTCDML